ncbi:AraC family transcriptional regulator [Pedobacter gandavensis]|uniref:Helix-turn-helix domain-containing protein n=1 Tax=Pedobacter gandavensis TaxID=2679963 RepID=A0ABR6ESQ6_9SPHI|nr:helix-turn-helix domain-containing protein [Pedobacter gandavensis]MBB2148092.1 helix-turn-helix domain-containing protein [Pedobacter gandavensis]
MDFQTFPPSEILRPYVRYFYRLETKVGLPCDQKMLRTIADGCPGIIFQEDSKGKLVRDQKVLPSVFLFGQSTKPSDILLTGSFDTLGVCLHPNALNSLFGLNAELLTDSCLELDELSPKNQSFVSERLNHTHSTAEKIEVLSHFLLGKIKHRPLGSQSEMQFAMNKMMCSNGAVSLKMLQQELFFTERSFERKFKQYVGITPKLFSRICRFQSSLKQLNNHQFDKLSDLAYESNYADQSHFIRSFKEFTGLSPHQYRKRSTELAENLSELTL